MKLQTAINHAQKIHDRLKALGGIIGTPDASYEAFKVKSVWVFGSTIKGKSNPIDLDIAVNGASVGRRAHCSQWARRHILNNGLRKRDPEGFRCTGKLDKQAFKRRGMSFVVDSRDEAVKYLKNGMRGVSVHLYGHDDALESKDYDIHSTKVMLYPRNDFIKLFESKNDT